MNALSGFAILLLLQTCGELLARALQLPFPAPVIGLLLLLLVLRSAFVQARVGAVADFLLAHLSLLFVPVGVGAMTHLDLVAHLGWRLVLVIVLSTWIGTVVTAAVLRWLLRGDGGNARGDVSTHAAQGSAEQRS
ncbi:MAG: CidA/LrgA family protein [Burkholderiales bacterium]|nr:CidA/LrgA family protein [Burkholderiales bacterium]